MRNLYRRVHLPLLLGAALAVLGCSAEPLDPGPWPQWRGAGSQGVSAETGLPEVWDGDGINIRWRTEIPGDGNSSPVVSGGKVFLTTAEMRAQKQVHRSVLAVDFDSGELLWRTEIFSGPKPQRHHVNTFAAPTVVADGRFLFAHFGSVLAKLDYDGNVVWQREIDADYVKYSRYGAGSSPVLTEDAVIVAHDREWPKRPNGWLAAFDRDSGEELWKNVWDDTCCSYSTPLIVDRGAGTEIIFPMSGKVVSFDAETGETLWRHDYVLNQPVPTAALDDDLLAVFGGGNRVRYGVVMRLTGAGRDTKTEVLWDTKRIIPQTPSPVLYNGVLYVVVDVGAIIAYQVETGRRLWLQRLPRGNYQISLTAGDGKVYATNQWGITTVIAAEPQWRMIAQNNLKAGGVNASPAIAEGRILMRTRDTLVCIESAEPVEPGGSEVASGP